MLKMMADATYVKDHSTDAFTTEELEDAKQYLVKRMTEFYEDSDVGYRLRAYAIKSFKKKHELKDNLENENDVSYAVDMNAVSQYKE